MKVQIHFQNLIGAILALIVFVMTANGSILNYIHFADVLNEMFFAFTAAMMSVMFFFMSFSKIK